MTDEPRNANIERKLETKQIKRELEVFVYRRMTLFGRRWYWRVVAANHRIVCIGGESFRNRLDVLATLAMLKRLFPGAPIHVEGTERP